MPEYSSHTTKERLGKLPLWLQWLGLVLLSAGIIIGLEVLHLPAAPLLGAMLAAIAFGVGGGTTRVPKPMFILAQGIIGCMIARGLDLPVFDELLQHKLVFASGVLGVVITSIFFGWLLAYFRILPTTTAILGSCPGGASAMVVMADAYGADARLVAFMQYIRIVLVVALATLVARLSGAAGTNEAASIIWFPQLQLLAFVETLGIIASGALLQRFLRMPSAPMLIPLILGTTLQNLGLVTLEMPPWLIVSGGLIIGWNVGMRFTWDTLVYAARISPWIILSTCLMIAACGGLAWLMAQVTEYNTMTVYLAMSPGATESIALIAAASAMVNVPFVMAMQTLRFLVTLLFGPVLAHGVAWIKGLKKNDIPSLEDENKKHPPV